MKLRKEQMQAFSDAAARRYEDRMVEHVQKFFPARCEQLGEPGVREELRYGIGRAKTYGITSQRDVCKYVDLMFVYGRDFDVDEELPWAREVLTDKSIHSPTDRTNRLFAAGQKFLKEDPAVSKKRRQR